MFLNNDDASVRHCSCFCRDGGILEGWWFWRHSALTACSARPLCGGTGCDIPLLGWVTYTRGGRAVIAHHQFCIHLPQDPAFLQWKALTFLSTLFFLFFCKTWTLLLTVLYLCLVRDLTLLVGWFDELPSALNFSMGRNMLWKYWDFFFRIGIWQISQNFFRQEVK